MMQLERVEARWCRVSQVFGSRLPYIFEGADKRSLPRIIITLFLL